MVRPAQGDATVLVSLSQRHFTVRPGQGEGLLVWTGQDVRGHDLVGRGGPALLATASNTANTVINYI
jgi:hypothetical protein